MQSLPDHVCHWVPGAMNAHKTGRVTSINIHSHLYKRYTNIGSMVTMTTADRLDIAFCGGTSAVALWLGHSLVIGRHVVRTLAAFHRSP